MGLFSKLGKAIVSAHKKPVEALVTDPIKSGSRHAAKGISSLFAPDINIPSPAEAPQADLSGVLAAEAQRRRQARAKGRASTILTSSQGAAGTAKIGTKTLLGS